ncbi:23S rRNA (guanosine(2251)-2'-O)-methyltransferase RlmB [Clostridioides difficile]|nr:23S rRNA (guanosine(2251)-2'-O)-methyltransferase RlmB [Clostridioides difficile]PTL52782.1 23S rRNA (guanosine(2251)-2'-O)-methyltransferase RlmB [Clostridioides difficile]
MNNLASIEGRNPVIEAIKSDREIDKILIANSAKEGSIKKIIGMAKDKNIIIQYVDKHKLDEVSTSHSHQGVIAYASEYKYYELDELIDLAKDKDEDPFFIILDEITDPHNLGSIIRTADAVGAHGVIIPKRRSVHITPVVAKASAGAVEYMPVCKVTNIVNTIKRLKEEGLWIAAADMDGETFYKQNLTGPLGVVIGSEGFGISRLVKQNCDFIVKMPMIGNVTSLNASVAGGILLYEIFRQRLDKSK